MLLYSSHPLTYSVFPQLCHPMTAGMEIAMMIIMQWQTVHLLLETYRLSSYVALVLRASNSLKVDFFVLSLLLPWQSMPIKRNATKRIFMPIKELPQASSSLSSDSMQKPMMLMQRLINPATKILLPGKSLRRAKIKNTNKLAALTQHTTISLCLKLRKQMKEEVSSKVIDMIAFKIQIFPFSCAHSSRYPSNAQARSTKTIATNRQNTFAVHTERYSIYWKKVVPTINLRKRLISAATSILIIHSPSLIILTFSDLQNMEHSRKKCKKATPVYTITAFLFLTHSILDKSTIYALVSAQQAQASMVSSEQLATPALMSNSTTKASTNTSEYPILMTLLRVSPRQTHLLMSVLKQQILLNIYNIRFVHHLSEGSISLPAITILPFPKIYEKSVSKIYHLITLLRYLKNTLAYQHKFHKIKLIMYKASYFGSRSQQNIPPPSISSPSHQYLAGRVNNLDRIDLRKFNEYLEEKISSKVYKNYLKNSRREAMEGIQHAENVQFSREKPTRPPSAQKGKEENRAKDWGNQVSWKRHQSIEKLLERQNKGTNRNQVEKKYGDNENLMELEGKYMDLQDKYKRLMQEAITSNKEYEENQRQLLRLKSKHNEDQEILMQLQRELMGIQKSKSAKLMLNVQTETRGIKSQQIIESDVSITTSDLAQQQPWKAKQADKRQRKNSNFHSKGHKTSESWMNKKGLSNVTSKAELEHPDQAVKRQSWRYYSAQKMSNSTRRNNKTKQMSDHSQYTQIESKTSIKYGESLSSSKVKLPKQCTKQLKFESQKAITPTTLHKKMLNSNHYSKFRFQPTVRLN